ncbi:MAG: TlpA disulfide reductase family protein [Mycobacteriales bacterium]
MRSGPGLRRAAPLLLVVLLGVAGCARAERSIAQTPQPAGTTAATAGLLAKAALSDCPPSPAAAGALPDIALPCLDGGGPVRLARLGRPTVLNLWASWCGPCARELPVFAAAQGVYAGRVLFIGVDTADSVDPGLRTLIDAGVRYPSVSDRQRTLQRHLGLAGLPVTVFVRADGSVAYTKLGAVSGAEELRTLLRTHLGVSP